jgi:hypothetical protein
MHYSVIAELSTSSTRNAHVLTLFESSRKMVQDIAEKVDTWMQRSAADIQAFEDEGYDYGLRMFTAFARVVGHCFQAHENTMSEEVLDQKKQAESLREWNRIALHRCRCEACLHLEQINKHHLASLPLWLCEEYASREEDIDIEHVDRWIVQLFPMLDFAPALRRAFRRLQQQALTEQRQKELPSAKFHRSRPDKSLNTTDTLTSKEFGSVLLLVVYYRRM